MLNEPVLEKDTPRWKVWGIILSALALLVYVSCNQQAFAQEVIIKHKAYTIYFQPKTKCPDSVSWNLNKIMLTCGAADRLLTRSSAKLCGL